MKYLGNDKDVEMLLCTIKLCLLVISESVANIFHLHTYFLTLQMYSIYLSANDTDEYI